MLQRVADPLPFADDPVLLALAAYWSAKRSSRPMPERGDIDALDMPRPLLPHLGLAEFLEDGTGVRYRLAGTELADRYGAELTGRTTAELFHGEYRVFIEGLYGMIRRNGAALYSESQFRFDAGGVLRTRRLMLPLARAGRLDLVLFAQTWPMSADGTVLPPQQKLIDCALLEQGLARAVDVPRLSVRGAPTGWNPAFAGN